jgi:iron complex outermembrane receptor protein
MKKVRAAAKTRLCAHVMASASSLAFSLVAASVVHAQATQSAQGAQGAQSSSATTIGEVIVTATRLGATNLQKTPIAVSALSGAQLATSVILSTHDLGKYTPSVQIAQNNGFAEIYIRGVGSNNVFNGSDPDVTVNIDGVYIARSFGEFTNFLDVGQVEVLRGPQGTLYGRNAAGGTINVTSLAPTDYFTGEARVTGGNYNEVGVEGYVSGPIDPGKADFSLAAEHYQHDAYQQNIVPGEPGVGSENQSSARAQLLLTPSSNLKATTRVDIEYADEADEGNDVLLEPYNAVTDSILGNYHKVAVKGPTNDLISSGGIAEDIYYTVNPYLTLRSVTAARFDDYNNDAETDGSNIGYQFTHLRETEQEYSQELTANGKIGRFDYVGGIYLFDEQDASNDLVTSYKTNTHTVTKPVTHDQSYAAYANVDYRITDALTVIAGIRYTVEDKNISQWGGNYSNITGLNADLPGPGIAKGGPSSYTLSHSYDAPTPKVALQYQIDPNLMAYVSATRGFKSGGFNETVLPANASTQLVGFAPEELWSYEAGIKSEWFEKKLKLNVTAFHYDYTDMQVQAFLVPGQTSITNAASAHVDGVEFEAEFRPIRAFDIGANVSLLNAKYANYPDAPSTGTATVDATGHYLNESPPFSMNTWAQYNWDLPDGARIWVRGEYSYQTRVYFTAVNDDIQTQAAYGLANFLVGWNSTNGRWGVDAYIKNALNQQYIIQTGSFSATPAGTAGPPMTIGAQVSRKF